jgi:hypothetical protein
MDPGMNPGVDPGMNPGMNPGPTAVGTPIVVAPLPSAPFNPAEVPNGEVQGWAYDTTAAADSTYRYRIRYQVLNPIFGANNVAANPALAQAFSIVAEDKNQWSEPITIAPLTHIFLAARPTQSGSAVRFTVFRWQAGKRHRSATVVSPGDSIGRVEGEIDFRTNWTLVEVRLDSSSSNPYALLMNADGVLRKQDFNTDEKSPELIRLNFEVDGTMPPAAPGGIPGAAPGGPPGRPGMPGGQGPRRGNGPNGMGPDGNYRP